MFFFSKHEELTFDEYNVKYEAEERKLRKKHPRIQDSALKEKLFSKFKNVTLID